MVLAGIMAFMLISTFCFYYCPDVFFSRSGFVDLSEFPGLLVAAWCIITFAGGYILGKYWWQAVYIERNHWYMRKQDMKK